MNRMVSVLFLVPLLMLAGCLPGQMDAGAVIMPPMIAIEQKEMVNALRSSLPAGQNIDFVYPLNGEHRSAFVLSDLNKDRNREAIVFYRVRGAPGPEPTQIRINILSKESGSWESTDDISGEGMDIDKVMFGYSGFYGEQFVIIGFAMPDEAENLFRVYTREDGRLKSLYENTYIVLETIDINNDGDLEIVYIRNTTRQSSIDLPMSNPAAHLIKYENGRFIRLGETQTDPNVIEYVNIAKGNADINKNALYLDGRVSASSYNTQILMLDEDGIFTNAVYSENSGVNLLSQTERIRVPRSVDVDRCGVIEIPRVVPLPGWDENDEDALFLTDWYEYIDGNVSYCFASFVNIRYGYIFRFPPNWINRQTGESMVSAVYFPYDDEIVFFRFEENLHNRGEELLRIRRTATNNDEYLDDDYFEIKTIGSISYMGMIQDTVTSELSVTRNMVINLFAEDIAVS
ncbi:MAG: hypothetical protein FWH14_02665 [Oscillospiraceae bacterium]|nr:hypothetical protein [Oscillospiraceae bacterium]